MSKLTQCEMEITGNVPQEVKDRVRRNLYEREIDFSDVPEITEWPESKIVLKVPLDNDVAMLLNEKAASLNKTPIQVVNEILKSAVA